MIVINQKFKMIIHKFRLTKTMPGTAVSSKCPTEAATQSTPPSNDDVWVDIDNYPFDDDPPELPYDERVNLAHKAFINSNRQEHIKVLARKFGINWTTLQGRINGAVPKALAN
jgi:hypothetical protein